MIKDPVKLHQLLQDFEKQLNDVATDYDAHIFLTDDNKVSKVSFSDTFVRDKAVVVTKRIDGTHTQITAAVDKTYPEYYPDTNTSDTTIPHVKIHRCERTVVEHAEISSSAFVRHFDDAVQQITAQLENAT